MHVKMSQIIAFTGLVAQTSNNATFKMCVHVYICVCGSVGWGGGGGLLSSVTDCSANPVMR